MVVLSESVKSVKLYDKVTIGVKSMKKIIILLGLLILSACGSKKDLKQEITECNYPDAPNKEAPLWVCGAKIEGVAVMAVGSTATSKAGINFMLQQASANARVFLAQQIQADIQASVKNFVQTTGTGTQETVDMVNSLVSNQITVQSLKGTRIIKQITSPTGTLYVAVGFDKELYEGFINESLNTSYKNEKALWQKAMSDKAFEDLKKDIEARM